MRNNSKLILAAKFLPGCYNMYDISKSLFDDCFVDSPVHLCVKFPEMAQRLVATITFSSFPYFLF